MERKSTSRLWAPLLALLVSVAATAQPTGSPKGTATPGTGNSEKSPAGGGGAGAGGAVDSGKLGADKGPADARTHTNRGPGTGTAGGLPKRNPEDGAALKPDGASTPARKPDPQ